MKKDKHLRFFTGTFLERPRTLIREIRDEGKGNKTEEVKETILPYLPDDDLVDAVNLAILLERPLLLMGEPGCGKTRLAEALAVEFYHDEADFRDYFFEWHIKSSTKAREGIYQFDAIRWLGEAQVLKAGGDTSALKIDDFIEYGEMAGAFLKSEKDPAKRAVLLIDEIDKADLDFPNDLLNELDRGMFTVPELKMTFRLQVKPIVIITSNQEKPLPDAFLRRCVYHYIEPLGADQLKRILRNLFYKKEDFQAEGGAEALKDQARETFLTKVVQKFLEIREEIKSKERILGKNVSTSELIDWFRTILFFNGELDRHRANLQLEEREARAKLGEKYQPLKQLEAFEKDLDRIPFLQVLFKDFKTLSNFKDQAEG